MLLEARHLRKSFLGGRVKAVNDVSFGVEKGRTLGVVGESGSGKSTLAKLVLRLLPLDGGELGFEGENVGRLAPGRLRNFRRKVQVVFQEPFLSLDPRMTVFDILSEPFHIRPDLRPGDLRKKTADLLAAVELDARFLPRRPRQLSGGECQRVAIARAISTDPALIVCDEPVSSLDVLIQAQILNLLIRLQRERGVSYLFISHDLRVIRHMSDDVIVMQEGCVREAGPRDEIYERPKHPYTRKLLESVS